MASSASVNVGRPATASPARGSWPTRHPRLMLLLFWLLFCIVALVAYRHSIARFEFIDVDDAMRLQQVRDWIAGQGWFDVSQHRVNPPFGGPMHWSRIVDLPIAAIILLARPLVGMAHAEVLACIIVPLVLAGCLCLALYHAVRRVTGDNILPLFSVALLLVTPTVLIQFPPLRIDHHGWQILMAAIALCGALDPHRIRGGVTAAVAMAVWLTISSEGLPYAALFGAIFALRQWIDGEECPRLTSFGAVLGPLSFLLVLSTRGWTAITDSACDSLSSVYLLPLCGFAIAMPVASRLLGSASGQRRFAAAAVAGGGAVALLLLSGRHCLTDGPFSALSPMAYRYWYLGVLEGRPVWEQGLNMGGVILLPALTGLIGTFWAWRASVTRKEATAWMTVGLSLLGATLVSIAVMRAITVAHLFALPGTAWLLLHLLRRAQGSTHAIVRIMGSAVLMVLTPTGLSAAWLTASASPAPEKIPVDSCRSSVAVSALNALPRSLLFAPVDLGPDILFRTPHSVIGTGHHRNLAGINAVVGAFLDRPADARAIIMAAGNGTGADYVIICPGLNDLAHYAKASPDGLAARLAKGQVPYWLTRVPMAGPIQAYKVIR